MIFSTTIFNLLARTLAKILHTAPTRLIGRNSLMSTALGFFRIREMRVALKFFTNVLFFSFSFFITGHVKNIYAASTKILEDDVCFKHLPTSLEKSHSKIIWTWGLVIIEGFHHLKDIITLKGSLQPIGLLPTMESNERPSNLGRQLNRSVNKLS